jgi:hypothetical protein
MEKILEVTEVKLGILESFPPQLSISASGLASTPGWSNPELKPHVFIQPPPDGIYDFDFVADRPTEIVPQHVVPIEAGFVMRTFPETLKGVRIHASQNSKTALLNPGTPAAEPNRYTFSDSQGVKRAVFYPTAHGPLVAGEPHGAELEYSGPEGQLRFRGDDVHQEQNVLGTLISVVIRINADAGGLNFALALPPVHLGSEKKQKFKTVGIMVHSRGRVINPAGPELTYELIPLDGIAENVRVPL